jgi:hypothetical protein
LTIAITMPIRTKTTIAICIQTQVGDMFKARSTPAAAIRLPHRETVHDYRGGVPRLAKGEAAPRRAALRLALALSALALLAGCAAQGASAAGRLLGGVNMLSLGRGPVQVEAERAVAAASQAHVRILRVDLSWNRLQPNGPAQMDPAALAYYDRLANVASAAGIKLVMTVGWTPCWASSAPRSLLRHCTPGRSTRANTYPPLNASDYGAFVAQIARRYGFALAAIEVWNEPDQSNEDYFGGRNKAAHYAAVLRAAYPAVKAANPGVRVLGGSLVGSSGVFLRALYAAGIKGYYDGLSVHYYTLTLAALRQVHEVQRANGDSKPLWLDEFGWSSCYPHRSIEQEQGCVTAQMQSANIVSIFSALERVPYVEAAILYKLRDSPGEEFGVLRANGARKQSFTALSQVLGAGGGDPGRVTLSLSRQGNHVLASGAAPVGDYMLLEAFQGSVPRYRALFSLDRFNRYAIPLPAVLGRSGLRVRVSQFSAGLSRAAVKSI